MDRLTVPDERIDERTTRRKIIDARAVRERSMEIYWRLKALEDIVSDKNGQYGLEDINFILNEEIVEWRKLGPLGAVQSLIKADGEGRLVELPCKVGDTVYFAAWFGTRPHIVKRIIEPYFYTDDAESNESTADFSLRDFGKFVFLTREAAEEALRGDGTE